MKSKYAEETLASIGDYLAKYPDFVVATTGLPPTVADLKKGAVETTLKSEATETGEEAPEGQTLTLVSGGRRRKTRKPKRKTRKATRRRRM